MRDLDKQAGSEEGWDECYRRDKHRALSRYSGESSYSMLGGCQRNRRDFWKGLEDYRGKLGERKGKQKVF